MLHAPPVRGEEVGELHLQVMDRVHLVGATYLGVDAFREVADIGCGHGISSVEIAKALPASEVPGSDHDLICFFDALHDMGDPVGALVRAREALAADVTVMLIEPLAADEVVHDLNPVGRLYDAASTLGCTANGIAQGNRPVLGAQAGEAALRDVLAQAGFTRIRRITQMPFNMVLEARS